MQERLNRFAQEHERLVITAVVPALLAGTVLVSLDAAREDESSRGALVILWVVATAAGILHQLYLWTEGRLIVRDPDERERLRRKNESRIPLYIAIGVAVSLIGGAGVLGVPVRAIVAATSGGLILAYTPVLLWIAWVIRPGQRRGEWL